MSPPEPLLPPRLDDETPRALSRAAEALFPYAVHSGACSDFREDFLRVRPEGLRCSFYEVRVLSRHRVEFLVYRRGDTSFYASNRAPELLATIPTLVSASVTGPSYRRMLSSLALDVRRQEIERHESRILAAYAREIDARIPSSRKRKPRS